MAAFPEPNPGSVASPTGAGESGIPSPHAKTAEYGDDAGRREQRGQDMGGTGAGGQTGTVGRLLGPEPEDEHSNPSPPVPAVSRHFPRKSAVRVHQPEPDDDWEPDDGLGAKRRAHAGGRRARHLPPAPGISRELPRAPARSYPWHFMALARCPLISWRRRLGKLRTPPGKKEEEAIALLRKRLLASIKRSTE